MSLFKRPAWAKQQLDDSEAEGKREKNLFSHSHSYQDIVAEQEKRKRGKAERKKAKTERRTSAKREVEDEPVPDGTPKTRRINQAEREKLLNSVGLPAKLEDSDGDEPPAAGIPARRSPRKNKRESSGEAVKAPRPAQVIDLGGSSSEDNHDTVPSSTGAIQPGASAPVEELEDDSDDEFAHLTRKARQQRQQSNGRSSRTPNAGLASPSPGVNANHDSPPEPVIQLFITSPLPNTNPLIVQRKLGQSTGPIREAWCQKQGFPKELMDSVFFVHRMRRVYDVTTCRSLGLEVDQYGNVFMKGAEGKEGVEKVHLVAVTDEAFAEMKRLKAKEALGGVEPAAEGKEESAPAPEKEESNIRVVLRAKGQSDLRLRVKASTDMEQLAAAYVRKQFGHHSEQQVRLEFDGEELDPSDMMQSTEISDMDIVDVRMIS